MIMRKTPPSSQPKSNAAVEKHGVFVSVCWGRQGPTGAPSHGRGVPRAMTSSDRAGGDPGWTTGDAEAAVIALQEVARSRERIRRWSDGVQVNYTHFPFMVNLQYNN